MAEGWDCVDTEDRCALCVRSATHKIAEDYHSQVKHPPLSEILRLWEEAGQPGPRPGFHTYTSYVCCKHFRALMGPAIKCKRAEEAGG